MTLEQQLVNIAENTLKVYEAGKEENKEIWGTHEERIASVEKIAQKTEELPMKKGNGLYSVKMNQTQNNTADGESATAFGYSTKSNGKVSIAGGNSSEANDNGAFAMGYKAKANGKYSVAMGHSTEANGVGAIALGYGTKAGNKDGQIVVGKYNADNEAALFIVGSGTSSANRKNAFEVTNGGIKVGSTSITETQFNELLNPTTPKQLTNDLTVYIRSYNGRNWGGKGFYYQVRMYDYLNGDENNDGEVIQSGHIRSYFIYQGRDDLSDEGKIRDLRVNDAVLFTFETGYENWHNVAIETVNCKADELKFDYWANGKISKAYLRVYDIFQGARIVIEGLENDLTNKP